MLGVLQIARRLCLNPILSTRTGPLNNLPILQNLNGILGAEAHVQISHLGQLGRVALSTRTISMLRPVCRSLAAERLSAATSLIVKTSLHLTLVGQVQRPVEANSMAT